MNSIFKNVYIVFVSLFIFYYTYLIGNDCKYRKNTRVLKLYFSTSLLLLIFIFFIEPLDLAKLFYIHNYIPILIVIVYYMSVVINVLFKKTNGNNIIEIIKLYAILISLCVILLLWSIELIIVVYTQTYLFFQCLIIYYIYIIILVYQDNKNVKKIKEKLQEKLKFYFNFFLLFLIFILWVNVSGLTKILDFKVYSFFGILLTYYIFVIVIAYEKNEEEKLTFYLIIFLIFEIIILWICFSGFQIIITHPDIPFEFSLYYIIYMLVLFNVIFIVFNNTKYRSFYRRIFFLFCIFILCMSFSVLTRIIDTNTYLLYCLVVFYIIYVFVQVHKKI